MTVVMPHLYAADVRIKHLYALPKPAENAGAKVEALAGTNAIEAVTSYTRRHGITKAVIGWSPEERRRSVRVVVVALRLVTRLEHRLPSGGLVEALARRCPEVDVVRAAVDPTHTWLQSRAAEVDYADVRSGARRAADAQAGWFKPVYMVVCTHVGMATVLSSLA